MPPKLAEYESLSPRVRLFLWLIDRFGAVRSALWRWRWRRRVIPRHPQRILVTRCDGIGDLVESTPALRSLRKRFPDARIELMVGPWAADVARMIEDVDEVLPYAPWGYRFLRTVRRELSLGVDWRWLWRLRRRRYDLAIDLRSDILTLLPMAWWAIPVRVGRATRGGGFTLTHEVPPVDPARSHEVRRTLDVVARLDAEAQDERLALSPGDEAVRKATQVLREAGLSRKRTVLLAPGAQWRWKWWPGFGDLAHRLHEAGWQTAVIGAPGDEHFHAAITERDPATISLIGRFNLRELTAAFALTRGFVAVDSGPAHLAAGVDAAGVMLFGSGQPEQFAPLSEKIRIIHRPCAMNPCYQRGECVNPDQWCMVKISASEVFAALTEVLESATKD
ncbi:MAG: glycosyltransferase family 9 protein [Candidatus Lernaella stagnicola]|nr:glycosyltransferase family 9 protein [Candidatus Lernaella stagnicola]